MSAGKADVVRLKADKLDQLLRREHGQQVGQPLAKLFEDFFLCAGKDLVHGKHARQKKHRYEETVFQASQPHVPPSARKNARLNDALQEGEAFDHLRACAPANQLGGRCPSSP